jgi:predicted Zn-dependent peptidase
VVCEEFKEHYLTKPYGDVWHKMRELAYKKHPYRWMTIGKELSHIEQAKLEDVKNFFFKHYRPVNAVLVVAGNVTMEKVKELSEKWFGDIPAGEKYVRNLPAEDAQMEERKQTIKADVPLDALYKCWHMGSRLDKTYHATDLLTDILSGGGSSRLYQSLVKEKQLFSNIECHHFGSTDNGLVVVEGKLVKGVSMDAAEKAVEAELEKIKNEPVSDNELQKVKNKTESMIAFEDMSVMSRANSLAYYEVLGDANWMNDELEKYASVTTAEIQQQAQQIFRKENCNTIHYLSAN